MQSTLRNQAEVVSLDMGFSSLQEVVRLVLTKLAKREIGISIEQFPAVKLSARNERRYNKMLEKINSGKEVIYEAKNANDLLDQLYGRKNPVRAKISKKL